MTATRLTPSSAVELQDELVRQWRTPIGLKFMDDWGAQREKSGARPIAYDMPRAEAEARLCLASRLYLISEDMLALANHAAASMPAQPVLREDLPCPLGIMVFERGLPVPDLSGRTSVLLGIRWNGLQDMQGDEGVSWMFYGDTRDERDDSVASGIREFGPVPAGVPRMIPLQEDVEAYGAGEIDPEALGEHFKVAPENVVATLRSTRRLALALWSLIRDWAEVTEQPIERHARRRLERAGSKVVPLIRVVRLRRQKQEVQHPVGSIAWSHRWIVSGHWRRQWYASIQAHRLKWITPFVKGPADKPMQFKRTVHHLVR